MESIKKEQQIKMKTNIKVARPKKRTLEETRLNSKLRSRLYYADPKHKEENKLKVRERLFNNRKVVYERQNRRLRLFTLEKRLTKIWILKGLLHPGRRIK